jgi:hypothetical protein
MQERNAWDQCVRVRDDLESTLERIDRLHRLGDRGADAAETLREEMLDMLLSVDTTVTVDALLTYGGPTCFVSFRCHKDDRGGLEPVRATIFWGHGPDSAELDLDDDLMDSLWEAWALECA